ncbi:MAG: HAD family phosphatase [Desulfobacterales bacterium]|nr:HAD family phosphatase [Desulfobacterales bacterium]
MSIKAIIFDLGGVILDSPFEIFAAFEKQHGLSENFLNRVIVESGRQGAWARLERGELTLEDFFDAFDEEIRHAGANISSRDLMSAVNDFANLRPEMIHRVRRLREAGYRVGALTNNWFLANGSTSTGMDRLRAEFDVFVESSRAGVAKPDPKIYEMVLDELGVNAEEAVFLDDIGRNLKPAREMGMTTIKVTSVENALTEMDRVLAGP